MKILHYFLGFPPYRTGGLTKYAFDLMQAQAEQDNTVMALWPGQMGILSKQTKIKKRNSVNGIENYELINPLPVSLDEGITAFDEYMKPCNSEVYQNFLKNAKPEVIHLHTLMGLHKVFFEVTKQLNIRTVFTTHDYYGLCPKVTLFRYGVPCKNDHGCKDCIPCNYSALSIKKIRIMQSPLYRYLKNSALVKQLRKQHRGDFFSNDIIPEMPVSETEVKVLANRYKKLREYNIGMLTNVDLIHFNSTVTESVYHRYFTPKAGKVMTIAHKNIVDNRKVNNWKPKQTLRITCLASAKPFKGFTVLKNTLDNLWNLGKHDFELKMYSPVKNPSPYMKVQEEGFQYSDLGNILAETDVLIAPSVWYETFGFTVLEAISYGVPVIVSNHVGAQDIVGDGGIVVEAGSEESLKEAILMLTPNKLLDLRTNIQEKVEIKTWRQFLNENYALYEG
ncbi:glycosyltransferase [Desulfosporosinus sp. FKA]|uniref:glycosyltransferase n=1 Tax=Desulfosporosinus sp. FKA TaxID=1969834 RepID=UPI001552CE50|nr:glycosyltransferase [Desulfosporosinus sp. FKA]